MRVRFGRAGALRGVGVSYRGGGVTPPQRRRLFDFGWRGPGGETSAPSEPWRDGAPADGLGLGLPLARLHARQMGGDVEVVSARARRDTGPTRF